MPGTGMYLGVDGCRDGWVAVAYRHAAYAETTLHGSIEELWDAYERKAETILIDIPIGLRERSREPRACDVAAREKLSPHRHSSVFPPPVRAAVHEDSYEAAKGVQEARTDGSLGVQAWGIADKIAELDTFLRETEPNARSVVREAHPEVCFWALNDGDPMRYSKTGQPTAAFWERIAVLERTDQEVLGHLRDGGTALDAAVGLDDLVDAFVLAMTASPRTDALGTLPLEPSTDPTGTLPMEIVYAPPRDVRKE